MKKVLSVLLTVLCLTLVLSTAVSAYSYPSFVEGGIHVEATDGNTNVSKTHNNTGVDAVDIILATPTVSKLAAAVPGFPSTASNDVTLVGDFFDVSWVGTPGNTGPLNFTAQSDKIVSGVSVGVAHYSTTNSKWEFVKGSVSGDTASFVLQNGSPVILVVYKAKAPAPAPSGVVNTATY